MPRAALAGLPRSLPAPRPLPLLILSPFCRLALSLTCKGLPQGFLDGFADEPGSVPGISAVVPFGISQADGMRVQYVCGGQDGDAKTGRSTWPPFRVFVHLFIVPVHFHPAAYTSF